MILFSLLIFIKNYTIKLKIRLRCATGWGTSTKKRGETRLRWGFEARFRIFKKPHLASPQRRGFEVYLVTPLRHSIKLISKITLKRFH